MPVENKLRQRRWSGSEKGPGKKSKSTLYNSDTESWSKEKKLSSRVHFFNYLKKHVHDDMLCLSKDILHDCKNNVFISLKKT